MTVRLAKAMKKWTFRLSGMTAVLVFGTWVIPATSFAAKELARVNGSVITLEDFSRKYQENLKFFQLKPPTKKGVLDDLIKRELGIQEAKKLGLDKDPDVIERMNTVLYHALLEKKLSKEFESIHVTDSDAKSYYEKNPTIRTSHIFVALRPNAAAAEQKQAFEKIKKIHDEILPKSKIGFAEIAQKYSEGPAAPMGGDLDFLNKDRLDPVYYQAALALGTPGKISGIIRTQFGYHIVKLTAVRPWDEADQAAIKRQLFEEQRARVFDKYMSALRSQSEISVHAELLKE